MTVNTSTNNYACSAFIVAPTIAEGANYTTIAAAIAAASSGDTVFIKPGTYTEDLTLKVGVSLAAFGTIPFEKPGTLQSAKIVGKATFTGAGTVNITGIFFETNADNFLVVSGSVASEVNLSNCYFNMTNATGITLSSSSASSFIDIFNCAGNLGTTGIKYFDHSGAGFIRDNKSFILNSGGSTTASTISGSGEFLPSFCGYALPFAVSGTGTIQSNHTVFSTTSGSDAVAIANTSTVANSPRFIECHFTTGTATALTIGASSTTVLVNCVVRSSNAAIISGAGTLIYGGNDFDDGTAITVTTQTGLPLTPIQGGTGQNSYTTGDILYASATDVLSKLAVGSNGEVLTLAAGVPSWAAAGGGGLVVQRVVSSNSTQTTISSNIPVDNTIPQQTEGNEILTVTITPTSATNLLVLEYSTWLNTSINIVGAFFVDATADAIQAAFMASAASASGDSSTAYIREEVVAGSTSARTYKVRVGGTGFVQSVSGGAFGGVQSQYFSVTEIEV